MSAARHIEEDDLALFAMQLLSPEETAEALLHVSTCAACRSELAAVQGDLAIYAHTVELHSPPAQSRERLMKQVAREKKVIPIDRTPVQETPSSGQPEQSMNLFRTSTYAIGNEDEQPKKSKVLQFAPWAGWAVAAGLAITAGNFYHERDLAQSAVISQTAQLARLSADAAASRQLMETLTDNAAMRVTLKKSDAKPTPQGKTTYVPEKGSLVFIASNMDPLEQYKVYELWIIPSDGRDPVPAGTFKPDAKGNGSVIMPEIPKGVDAKAFAITIEDDGGSKTPTMPIIMSGA